MNSFLGEISGTITVGADTYCRLVTRSGGKETEIQKTVWWHTWEFVWEVRCPQSVQCYDEVNFLNQGSYFVKKYMEIESK